MKTGSMEEVRKAIEALNASVPASHLTIVHRRLISSERVVHTSMHGHKIAEAICIWILLGAHEQHVLAKVGQTRKLLGIVEGASLHRQSKGALLSAVVVHINNSDTVVQLRELVGPGVSERLRNEARCRRKASPGVSRCKCGHNAYASCADATCNNNFGGSRNFSCPGKSRLWFALFFIGDGTAFQDWCTLSIHNVIHRTNREG
mmetsp:Transcript_57673/g.153677  ORF Transcript_57673/g.153677 Transcript_57673/m.153677 type:complete len:204 (+) Transcript_57673:3147-3758(+)